MVSKARGRATFSGSRQPKTRPGGMKKNEKAGSLSV